MKILVVSDNHGDRDCLVDLVNHYEGQVDALFHCGDSELIAIKCIKLMLKCVFILDYA